MPAQDRCGDGLPHWRRPWGGCTARVANGPRRVRGGGRARAAAAPARLRPIPSLDVEEEHDMSSSFQALRRQEPAPARRLPAGRRGARRGHPTWRRGTTRRRRGRNGTSRVSASPARHLHSRRRWPLPLRSARRAGRPASRTRRQRSKRLTLTAASAERSGTAVVAMTHDGAPWAGKTIRCWRRRPSRRSATTPARGPGSGCSSAACSMGSSRTRP